MTLLRKDMDRLYMNYEGPFIIQIIATFAKFLMDNTVGTSYISKKLYRIFIEMAQNVALYSLERVALTNGTYIGKGNVHILENGKEFKCVTVNRILKEHAEILIRNCSEINATPIDDLRERKRKLYKSANIQDTGAHIGLIMIFIYSENPLAYEIIEETEGEIYFKIIATLSKMDNS